MSRKPFGAWLAMELRRREWSASDFARYAKVTPSMVSRWLRGTVPSPESCDVIADVLHADVDQVLSLAGHRPPMVTDDDPAMANLVATLRKIRLTAERETVLRSTLDGYLAYDQHIQAAASTATPAPRPDRAPAVDRSPARRTGGRSHDQL